MNRLKRSLSGFSAWILQPALVAVVLVVGFVAASRLSLRREPPPRDEARVYAPLVRTVDAVAKDHPFLVRGHGTLRPRSRIDLISQVGGEVIHLAPGLRAGGSFAAGDVLLRIEPVDYELAVARAEAEVSAASTALVTVRAESEAAIEEWERMNADAPCPPLVRREPQILEGEAREVAARAALSSARLDLGRTEVSLPFAGRVLASTVDVGQVIAPNQALGAVYASDAMEVFVPVRTADLEWLEVPSDSSSVGSAAMVSFEARAGPVELPGRIVRALAEVDASSRLASVVLEVPTSSVDPELGQHLLPGTFVDIELVGRTIAGAVELPRSAVRTGGTLWIVEQDRIRIVEPDAIHPGGGRVLVEGLAASARVVTSQLEVVTEGMQVRVQEQGLGR